MKHVCVDVTNPVNVTSWGIASAIEAMANTASGPSEETESRTEMWHTLLSFRDRCRGAREARDDDTPSHGPRQLTVSRRYDLLVAIACDDID